MIFQENINTKLIPEDREKSNQSHRYQNSYPRTNPPEKVRDQISHECERYQTARNTQFQ